jgi:uncharacterized membrane-anchored protein
VRSLNVVVCLPVVVVGSLLLAAAPAAASKAKPAAPEPAAEETPAQREFKSIEWTKGPAKVGIANHAEIQVPEGFAYTGATGAQKLLELMHNPTSGTELGILTDQEMEMFLLFEFEDIGYVKDADKEKLDGDEILKSLRAGNEESNKVRKERGWTPIENLSWHTAPFYNPQTNNLEWCIKAESQSGGTRHDIVNYNTRILGRLGVMSANLMVDPEKLNESLPVVKKLLGGFTYVEGKRYSQFMPGDKVAKYGLTALVVGGAVGIAAKTGLLAKIIASLGKLWKVVIVGIIGLLVGIKKLLFGRKREDSGTEPPVAPPPQAG